MRVGLVQLNGSDDPGRNLDRCTTLIRQSAGDGASFVLTPEMTNLLTFDRDWARQVVRDERSDPTLASLRNLAADLRIWLLVGSLAISLPAPETRLANRSFLIGPDGGVVARYDKIHMFDADPETGRSYRESSGYLAGGQAVVADTDLARIGLTICYDLRFPHLFRALARAGAQILTVPAAFTVPTGQAHWQVLLRARAIETGCFVLAPAQCGTNNATHGQSRQTWGHSLVVSPWGEVIADGGEDEGIVVAELDLDAVGMARGKIGALAHDRAFAEPVQDARHRQT